MEPCSDLSGASFQRASVGQSHNNVLKHPPLLNENQANHATHEASPMTHASHPLPSIGHFEKDSEVASELSMPVRWSLLDVLVRFCSCSLFQQYPHEEPARPQRSLERESTGARTTSRHVGAHDTVQVSVQQARQAMTTVEQFIEAQPANFIAIHELNVLRALRQQIESLSNS